MDHVLTDSRALFLLLLQPGDAPLPFQQDAIEKDLLHREWQTRLPVSILRTILSQGDRTRACTDPGLRMKRTDDRYAVVLRDSPIVLSGCGSPHSLSIVLTEAI